MRGPRSVSTAWSLVAALAVAAPALGAEQPGKPPEAAAKPAKPAKETPPKDKPVCTTEETTGSLIPKRVCRTPKQVEAQRQAVEDLNRERRELGGANFGDRSLSASGTLNGH